MKIPKIYCINLKKSVDRKKRMENRLKHLNLYDNATFINAVSRDSPLIDYYHQSSVQVDPDTKVWNSSMACFASHLKALRTFLEDGGDECLICEDDVMFINEFIDEYFKIRSNIPSDAPYVLLSYMIRDWDDLSWAGINQNKENLLTHKDDSIWGLQLYWMSKEHAIKILTDYDKPYENNNYMHSSESIVLHNPVGYLSYPVLAIEEAIDSERNPDDLDFQRQSFDS